MDEVEVVIKIPEEDYKRLVYIDIFRLQGYIEKGVVLPKEHGDLIDKNELIKNGVATESYLNTFIKTIIKADKEGKE